MRKKKDEYNYFDEFANNSTYIVESAEILKETVENYSQEKLRENIISVHKLENDADKARHHGFRSEDGRAFRRTEKTRCAGDRVCASGGRPYSGRAHQPSGFRNGCVA